MTGELKSLFSHTILKKHCYPNAKEIKSFETRRLAVFSEINNKEEIKLYNDISK